MGEIHYPMTINGNRSSVKLMALLDTGSIHNVIGYELPDGRLTFDIGLELYDASGATNVETINGEPQTLGTIQVKSIEIGGIIITDPRFTTFALAKIGDEAIIGHPLMQYLGMNLNLKNDKASI